MARGRRVQSTVKPTSADTKSAEVISIDDVSNVVVINVALAGKKTSVDNDVYEFDAEGKCEVTGKVAKYFMSCSKKFTVEGYENKVTEVKETVTEEPTTEVKETEIEE